MASPTFWQKTAFPGIRRGELAALALFYLFFALAYYLALRLNSPDSAFPFGAQIGINFLLRALLSWPVWWLMFRRLRHWPISYKILLHLPLCFLWAMVLLWGYHLACDHFKLPYLVGTGQVWDVYIPALFYVIQFAVFHVYDYYQRFQRETERTHALERLALESELAALKAQLNPHFLFNTLNSINASLPPALEGTRDQIAHLADMFRYPLSVVHRELVPLSEEIAFVENYLALEKGRFGERLQVDIHLEPGTEQCLVPPLIVQPLVENAVKHGISPQISGGKLYISAKITPESALEICVRDDGKGLSQAPGEWLFERGMGLRNTQLRLQKMFGKNLDIRQGAQGGLELRFEIPLNKHHG
jgi:two-component sensor histidine kinase